MTVPVKYVPGYSYSGYQANNPTRPLPAPQVDNDFANIATSVSSLVDGLAEIRRSDGRLKNGVVTPESLAASLKVGFTMRGTWANGTEYAAGDGVVYDSNFYSANVAHTAATDTNRPDRDDGSWEFLFSTDDIAVAGALSMPSNTFTGNGSQTSFTLTFEPKSVNNLLVTVGGVLQKPADYSVTATAIVFLTAPANGFEIIVRGFTTTAAAAEPADGSVTEAKLDTGVLAKIDGALQAATYDPNGVEGDVFDLANHSVTLDISGAVSRPVAQVLSEGHVSIHDLGVPTDSSNPRPAFEAALAKGVPLYIPDRVLDLPAETTTTGGVDVTLTKHVIVQCHPNAVIKAGLNLQARPLHFHVPADGEGLPDGGIIFHWKGGKIDISLSCNPTSVLWTAFYDRYRPGGTGSRAALAPEGYFTRDGVIRCGIKEMLVQDVFGYAGEHWIVAGGDNLIGAGHGVEITIIERCHLQGSRGTAVYGLPAWDSETLAAKYAGGKIIVRETIFDNCAAGLSLKQGVNQFELDNNLVRNSPAAFGIAGSGVHDLGTGGVIRNNRAENVTRLIGIQNTRGVTGYNNSLAKAGALDNEGNPITILMGGGPTATICVLEGAEDCDIEKVNFLGKATEHSATTFKMYSLGHYPHTDTTAYPTGYVKSRRNKMKRGLAVAGMADLGSEVSGQAEHNVFEENLIVGGSSLLTAIDPTSKWIAPKTGISYSYRDVSTSTVQLTTSSTNAKSVTVLAAEIPVGGGFRVRSAFKATGTNGIKTVKAVIDTTKVTISSQTSGEQQYGGTTLQITRVSSTGWVIEGALGEDGGTSGVVPFDLVAIGGNILVAIEVTLADNTGDKVDVYSLILEPL
jgi:hypothetical protein